MIIIIVIIIIVVTVIILIIIAFLTDISPHTYSRMSMRRNIQCLLRKLHLAFSHPFISHTHPLSHTLSHSYSVSLSHSQALALTNSISLAHTHTHTHKHTFTTAHYRYCGTNAVRNTFATTMQTRMTYSLLVGPVYSHFSFT